MYVSVSFSFVCYVLSPSWCDSFPGN